MTEPYKYHKRTHLVIDEGDIDLEPYYITNPEYNKAVILERSIRDIPEKLPLFSIVNHKVYLPRNVEINTRFAIQDLMESGTQVEYTSEIELRPNQIVPAERLYQLQNGLLQAPCGFGKTVTACYALAKVGVTTLVIVHTTALLTQWQERIKQFLGEEAGIVRGKKCEYKGKKIVIAMLQSLVSRDYDDEFYTYFGLVITDETHRIGALNWSQAIQRFPARRRWGITATPYRSDGLSEVVFAHIGKEIITVEANQLKPKVYQIPTGVDIKLEDLDPRWDNPKYGNYLKSKHEYPRVNIPRLVTLLSKIHSRNKLILSHIVEAAKKGRKILVTSERVEHLEYLYNIIKDDFKCGLYLGKSKVAERKTAEEAQIIFGSTSITKEGLDIPDISVLVMATPISNENMVVQMCGRILRSVDGKKTPVLIDFVDVIGICQGMAGKRKRIYQKENYKIE